MSDLKQELAIVTTQQVRFNQKVSPLIILAGMLQEAQAITQNAVNLADKAINGQDPIANAGPVSDEAPKTS